MPIGNVPVGQQQLIDGDFVNGITQGHNMVFQSGVVAAGSSSQATATQLPDRIAMFSIDTVTANSGVALPAALAGVSIFVSNNTGTNLLVYPSIANNPVTAAQDTINNTTSATVNAHTGTAFTCAKNGTWYTN